MNEGVRLQKVLAAVDWLEKRHAGKIGVEGYGEGGLLTEEARRKAAASQQEETDATAWQAQVNAAVTAMAAGAILSMLADTMMPEAYQEEYDFAGFITAIGFLVSFVLTSLGG